MSITSFPLAWPENFPRTKQREAGRFHSNMSAALGNVQTSLNRFARDSQKTLEDLVISSNVTLGRNRPPDPGVALWFVWDKVQFCIPIDRYHTVEANLQACHYILEARRVELRHGTLELVRASFRGFMLAAPKGENWWEVLEVSPDSTKDERENAYRRLVSIHHPDRHGGNDEKMVQINAAWQKANYA